MRALLIDPNKKIVNEIEIEGGPESISKALGCHGVRFITTLSNGDELYRDDDRFIDNLPPCACFIHLDKEQTGFVPGPGLLVGKDGDADAMTSTAELTSRIHFSWCRYWPDMGGVGVYSSEAEALR